MNASVCLSGIGPGRKPGYDVELLEEGTYELVGVVFGAECVELTDDACQSGFNVCDGGL